MATLGSQQWAQALPRNGLAQKLQCESNTKMKLSQFNKMVKEVPLTLLAILAI
jgi:hypothetical protein